MSLIIFFQESVDRIAELQAIDVYKRQTLDDALTEKVRKGAELMEIHVADHIILSPEKEYYSYHDEGKL